MKRLLIGTMISVTVLIMSGFVYAGIMDSVKGSTKSVTSAVPGVGGGLSGGDIETVFRLSKSADDLEQRSIECLNKMLLNKESIEKIDREKKAAQGIKNPKEKEAALIKVRRDQAALLEQETNNKQVGAKIAQLDEKQKKNAGAAIYNFFLSGLMNASAVAAGKGVVNNATSNPAAAATYATQIPRIKDLVASLPVKVEKNYTLSNKLMKLFKTSNVAITMPKSASDKPKPIAI